MRPRRLPVYFFLVLFLANCSPGRLMEAARVLADIDAGPLSSALKEQTPAPTRRPVFFEIDGRPREADLYRPGDEPVAGMVLVPGVTPAGRDDARLVAFAETLARARFEVLVPDLPRLRDLTVSAADARVIADACVYLDQKDGGRRPVGLTAISFAVGPAVAALFEPDMADRVDFVIAIGGYHDIEALITFVTTGGFRHGPDDPWQFRAPNTYGKWVFLRSNANRLDDPLDRTLLRRMAARKLEHPESNVSDLAASLGAQGRSVHALMVNDDPDRVPDLLAKIPARVIEDMTGLDLKKRDLGSLATHFILIHGRDDPVIPETESIRLAAALPDAALYLVDSLDHVNPRPAGLIDRLTLLAAINRVLERRDD
jgi:pimeloyl-ACP methyl ester carboxylesterase